jgi:hypothetical protein
MDIKNQKIALLVDGDNAQAKIMDLILEEASKYGKVTIRRVYGDWTTQHMNHWKSILNEMAFNPIQKFSYTTGKNSTDSALIIDAMDILHDAVVDGFCIVSSKTYKRRWHICDGIRRTKNTECFCKILRDFHLCGKPGTETGEGRKKRNCKKAN